MSRLYLLYVLAMGCSFRTNALPGAGGGPDASQGGEATPPIADAKIVDAAIDAPPDAKVYLDAPPVTGSLTGGVIDFGSGDANLTVEGVTDWVHWGYGGSTAVDRKATGSAISDATATGATKLSVSNVTATASWSDGTPNAAVSMTGTGTGVQAPGALSFTVPAGVTPHTLRVYCGNKYGTARLDAALSDGSATAYTNTQTSTNGALHLEYTLVYNAASDGQTLTVTWTDVADSSGGFEMLLSATLQ